MNEPRCQMGEPRCRNQAAGYFVVGEQRHALCEDDWLSLCEQMGWETEDTLAAHMDGDMGWAPLVPDPVSAAINRRLVALGQGAFG